PDEYSARYAGPRRRRPDVRHAARRRRHVPTGHRREALRTYDACRAGDADFGNRPNTAADSPWRRTDRGRRHDERSRPRIGRGRRGDSGELWRAESVHPPVLRLSRRRRSAHLLPPAAIRAAVTRFYVRRTATLPHSVRRGARPPLPFLPLRGG